MNLRMVHAFLIFLSAALAVVFGVWCVSQYRQGDPITLLATGILSFVVSFGLIAYDSWFLRKTRTLR